ncbi:MAG: SLATT domain-containing protein [Anaerolineae bacterium]|nr:SLATT domain-containing protein [Anaerolineae bacterium]
MQAANSTPTPEQKPEPPLLSPEEVRLRTEFYLQQRIHYQEAYYQNRVKEFDFNSSTMLVVSAVLMFLSSITSAWSASADSALLAFITAILPAFAAVVAAFRSLYQWDRQASIYQDTWFSLQEAELELEDVDYIDIDDYMMSFPGLIEKTETALQNEASQWGQIWVPTSIDPDDS